MPRRWFCFEQGARVAPGKAEGKVLETEQKAEAFALCPWRFLLPSGPFNHRPQVPSWHEKKTSIVFHLPLLQLRWGYADGIIAL